MSGELRTLIGLVVLIAALLFWLDFRDESHDEITQFQCIELNSEWQNDFIHAIQMSGDLDVISFECPSAISGLARGLHFLKSSNLSVSDNDVVYDFWAELHSLQPVIGDRPGSGLAGLASYGKKRIDINSKLLLKGNAVEVAGVLVHELRHLQQGFNSHVPCLNAQQLRCDHRLLVNPLEGGAYNYNVLFYDQILRSTVVKNQDKRSAATLLQNVLDKRFNAVKPELLEKYQP